MGAINSDGIEFMGELGRRITRITDDKRESAFFVGLVGWVAQW